MQDSETVIIGAGPAGLACAGALRMRGLGARVLEASDTVGSVWRHHYDRLHLHSAKLHSALPGLPMPKSYPRYPSRQQVVAYLEAYAAHFGIAPVYGARVTGIRREDRWQIATTSGDHQARHLIVATGVASFPNRADWPGLDSFPGSVLHSSDYRNPQAFAGQRVLVVGFGNSGGEIALDLAEAGATTAVAVRSPVNVTPRDVLGIPAQSFAIAERFFPPRLVDLINGGITRLRMGDITKLGLPKSAKGPVTQIVEDKRIPVIDIGTLDCIRRGQIKVHRGITRIEQARVHFDGGAAQDFDAIIQATGYRPDLRAILADAGHLDAQGAPLASGRVSGRDGLWFCGFKVVPTGHLREIKIEAGDIAQAIARDSAGRRT